MSARQQAWFLPYSFFYIGGKNSPEQNINAIDSMTLPASLGRVD